MSIREVGSLMFDDVTRTARWHGEPKLPEPERGRARRSAALGEDTPTPTPTPTACKAPGIRPGLFAKFFLFHKKNLGILHVLEDRLEDAAGELWGGKWIVSSIKDDRGQKVATFHTASDRMAAYVRENRFGGRFVNLIDFGIIGSVPEEIPGRNELLSSPRYRTWTNSFREPDPPLCAFEPQDGLIEGSMIEGCRADAGSYAVLEVNPLAVMVEPPDGKPYIIPMHVVHKYWHVVR